MWTRHKEGTLISTTQKVAKEKKPTEEKEKTIKQPSKTKGALAFNQHQPRPYVQRMCKQTPKRRAQHH